MTEAGGLFRIKTLAVILNTQFNGRSIVLEIYFHFAGSGMFRDVIQRFLTHAIDRHLHFGGQNSFSDYGHCCWDVCSAGECISQQTQQIAQIRIGQGRGSKFSQQGTHFGHGSPRQASQVFQ